MTVATPAPIFAKHVLLRPIERDGFVITAVTLRRPVPEDREAIVASVEEEKRRRDRKLSDPGLAKHMIAQLADLPVGVVARFSAADARRLTILATRAFEEVGLG